MQKIQICAALALLQVASMILNTGLFPFVADVSPLSREISTFCGAGFSIAAALAAYYKPAWLRERVVSILLLFLLAASLTLLCIGLHLSDPLLVVLGSPFGGIGLLWFSILGGVSLANLNRHDTVWLIPLAFVIAYGVQMLLMAWGGLSPLAAATGYFAAIVAAYLLVIPNIDGFMKAIRAHESPIILDVTNPSSFLPFSSLVFITIFLFNAACGFEANLSGGALPPFEAWLSYLPVVLLLILGLSQKSTVITANNLKTASGLLMLAGLLAIPLMLFPSGPLGFASHGATVFLRSGSDCFAVLMFFLIASIGAKNPLGSLTTSASALAASWVGIGCGAGAMGILQTIAVDSPETLIFTNALITFGFIAYIFAVLQHFSFDAAIAGVVPVKPLESLQKTPEATHTGKTATNYTQDPASSPVSSAVSNLAIKNSEADASEGESRFDHACAQVAAQYSLTAREKDVLELLARGRTSPVIQERLVVSHNTVKSHVRHIYAKLGVHSQQELIDVIDKAQ